MRKLIQFATTATACAAVLIPLTAQPAAAVPRAACAGGHFCAFDGTNYSTKLLDSTAGNGSDHIDVASDRTSSVDNQTGNYWCGVNNGFPDRTVLSVAPHTSNSSLDSRSNNKIDHFYVRSGGC